MAKNYVDAFLTTIHCAQSVKMPTKLPNTTMQLIVIKLGRLSKIGRVSCIKTAVPAMSLGLPM